MSSSPDLPAIETVYAGCRFRSRLEARWAVFFDELAISWQYEPEGFVIGGRPYLPDFLLPACGTWVEVKGSESALSHNLMLAAAEELPYRGSTREAGPRMLVLGPIPDPPEHGDLGWLGIDTVVGSLETGGEPDEVYFLGRWWGFGNYQKNLRPWILCNTSTATPVDMAEIPWLTPAPDSTEPGVPGAYRAARSARFEHGESGAPR